MSAWARGRSSNPSFSEVLESYTFFTDKKNKKKNMTVAFEQNMTLADLDTGAWRLPESGSQQVTRQVCGEHSRLLQWGFL